MSQVRNNPYRTIGAALGAGYVVGAGLPFFAIRLLRTMLVRYAVQAIMLRAGDAVSVDWAASEPSKSTN